MKIDKIGDLIDGDIMQDCPCKTKFKGYYCNAACSMFEIKEIHKETRVDGKAVILTQQEGHSVTLHCCKRTINHVNVSEFLKEKGNEKEMEC